VLCDYNMPYVDGLETVRLMREKLELSPERQPVFLLHSSSEEATLQQRCAELGILYRLTKPVKPRELLRALHVLADALRAKRNEAGYPAKMTAGQECPDQTAQDRAISDQAVSDQAVSDQSVSAQAVSELAAPDPAASNPEVTILIAEDVPMNMTVIKAMLHRLLPKANLLEALDGGQAVLMYRQARPDLILMDVQMPIMDGVEATKAIRRLEQGSEVRVPIVSLTAGVFKEERARCQDAGMDAFLEKPLKLEQLRLLLAQVLNVFEV
jgi:CheY-like chemotaxis protein